MDYVNTWGLYQCFRGTNDEMVASECRESFFALQPNGKVFHCIAEEKNTILLKYGEYIFRVNPKLYKIIPKPFFNVGDKVMIINKLSKGKIVDVNWHLKDDEPFYFIEINGKKDKKRYKNCDLRAVNECEL